MQTGEQEDDDANRGRGGRCNPTERRTTQTGGEEDDANREEDDTNRGRGE